MESHSQKSRNPCNLYFRTRKEFEAWCAEAASKYGYSVTCEGLGHAKEEAKALQMLMAEDLGASTQVRQV